MAHDVFVSYASVNKTTANAICHALEQNGVRCWIAPRDIPAGSLYGEQITKGIRDCKVFLLVFSDEVNRSPAVQKELERAVLGHRKTVVPFRIEDVPMNENIEFFLSDVHWMDIYPPGDTLFENLIARIQGILNADSCEAPTSTPDEANYDIHVELEKKFTEMFGSEKKSDNENNSTDQPVDYLGQQIIDYQISKMSTEGSSGEDTNNEIKTDKIGKHFSWYNPQGVKTVIFEVQRILLHDEEEDGWIWSLLPEELEYIEELQEAGATKQTFFVENKPEGFENHLVLVSFDTNNNCVHINMSTLSGIRVKVSLRPVTIYFTIYNYNTADVLADIFNLEKFETVADEKEADYTFNLKNPVFLLDPETAEMIKPTFTSRPDGLRTKGKVFLAPHKAYFAFQIRRDDETALNYKAASEYDVGMAYKDGTYGLKQNYYFARQWLEKASAMNNGQAQYELAHLYAEGKGGVVDKEKSMELLLKSAENGYDGANAIIAPSDELELPPELLDE